MSGLKNRRYIVTGASKGIGKAIATALVEAGARVVITGRDPARLERAASEIGAHGIVADAGREEDVVRSVREALSTLGGLDGLVNNAGIGGSQPIGELDAERFQRVWAVNVLGPALMVRECLPALEQSGGGDIVNISSTSGTKGDANATIYAATKFALRGMSQCWQAELRPKNIRVILVNPSYVQTNFGSAAEPAELESRYLQPRDIAHAVVSALAMEGRGFIPELSVFATNPWRE